VTVNLTATDLPGHLLVDWLADLPGDGAALLHRGLHGNREGDSPAALPGHGHTVYLRDLSEDCVALVDSFRSTDGVGHILLDHLADLPLNGAALGYSHTPGHCDAVRGDHLSGDWDTDWDLYTVRDSHTLGDRNTDWDRLAPGDAHSAAGLHWHTPALPLNLLLALRGSNCYWGNSNRSNSSSNTNRNSSSNPNRNSSSNTNRNSSSNPNRNSSSNSNRSNGTGNTNNSTTKTKSTESVDEELRICLGLSLSLTLDDKVRRVETQGANQRTNSSSRGSNNTGVVDDMLGYADLSLDLLAHVAHDVLALLPEGSLGNDLGLRGALLLSGALLLCGALLRLSALGLNVALLFRHNTLDILALLLCGALGLVVTDLLLHSLTDLLGNLTDHIVALSLSDDGALLLCHLPCCGVALLLSHSGAVLASLSPGGGDDPGGAGRVRDCPAGRAPHRVVHCPTLGLVAGVAVVGVSLGGREGEGQETGQQELHTDVVTSQQDKSLS